MRPKLAEHSFESRCQFVRAIGRHVILIFKDGIWNPRRAHGNEVGIARTGFIPIVVSVEALQLLIRQTMLQDTVRPVRVEAAAVLAQRFLE